MPINPAFPSASFHQLAEELKANLSRDPFALQVGAMDGVRFDMLHSHLKKGGWQGLLVEPVPDMFALLQQNYADCPTLRFANCAISESEGTLILHRVDPAAVKAGVLAEQALGVTTSFKDRGVWAHPGWQQLFSNDAARHIIEIEVPCCTLPNLLEKYDVQNIDLMMVDTEGADWLVARQLDLTRYHPLLVCLEYDSLTEQELYECLAHFKSHGYNSAVCQEDPQNILFWS